MAQADAHEVRPVNVNQTNEPNNYIIWLDDHMGKLDECILLKSSLFMALNPTNDSYERHLNKDDISDSICLGTAVVVRLDDAEFKLQAFVDIEKCYKTIKNNLDKRIFFITSGSKGEIIVPSLVANFEGIFGPHNRIYIFCANILMQKVEGVDPPSNTWALNFRQSILMFNHQDDLFVRMVSDIADYFFTEAKRLDVDQHLNNALQFYDWAKKLYLRFQRMGPIKKTTEIEDIEQRINDIQGRCNPQTNDESYIEGEACL